MSRVQAIYKLSPMQWGLLFHSLYEPGSGVYVEQIRCTLRGPLDVELFAGAWKRVLERHPILRTTFVWQGVQEPVQVVQAEIPVPLERHDWRDVPADERERRLAALAAAERSRGFDLSAGPLLRIVLVRTAEEEHQVVWSNHHLLLDGWSRAIVLGEAFAIYEALCAGREADLPVPPPFRSYIAWLERQDRKAVEAFWRESLSGFAEPTPVDFGALPGEAPEDAGAPPADQLALSRQTTAALQSLARRHRLTLNTLAQAAWALLLGRAGGTEDVVFGVTVSGRTPELDGIESMVGLFINTLPLRVQMPAEARLLPWLAGLQARITEMRQHESSSLAEVQRWSDVPAGTPLFDSVVVYENYPVAETLARRQSTLAVEGLENHASTNYPLALVVEPAAELSLRLVADPERYDAATLRRLLGHLRTLLEGFAASPDCTLEEIPLLGEAERRQILDEWNRTAVDYPADRTVPELFAAQAARTPEAVAVVCGDDRLTYGELDRRANQLARHLERLGVAPGALVGLSMDRCPEMVVSLLGILKAGAAYVPLDPSYPAPRLAFMLDDTGVQVVVSRSGLSGTSGSLPLDGRRIVCLDAEAAEIAGHDPVAPAVELTPEHLAYVSYTSGSTGRPKGVEVRHRGVVRLLFGTDFADLSGGRTLLQLSPIAFDASTLEIWGALLHGGRCVLLPQRVPTVAELGRALREHGVDTLWLTASLYNAVIDEAPESLAGVRQLLVGGEALSAPHVARGLAALPQTEIVNGYGPTESTTFTCCYRIPRQLLEVKSIPIGRPIGNTRVYVVDGRMRPVPVGAPGELLIGGAGLARGYLNRPELTAEKMVPDPFGAEPGGRLYRTGDRVRYRPDGLIEFLGRFDQQVKVRGFRIEPGEIEAALVRLPGVREAAVLVREEQPGGKRLVAYVVAEPDAGWTAAELRGALAVRLPEPMLPSAFVALPALPLTANGKLDRERLPAPEAVERADAAEHRAPRTDVEELLAGLFAQLLGLERVGIDDSFFELGGHSLLATQLISRIREAFATELPLRALFDAPTVAGLAEALDAARGAVPAPPIVAAPRDGRETFPLSFAQQRLWFLDQLLGASSAYNVFLPVRLDGPLDAAALAGSLDAIVRRHEILRTTFGTVDGEAVQIVHPAAPLPLPVVDLRESADPAAEMLRLAAVEARQPFDLGRGPLVRVRLLRLADTAHVALLSMHHIVSDGWSMGILVRELGALYEALAAGRPAPTLAAELPVQYADFAVWQRQWLQGEVLERQLAYWRRQLGGGLPALQLPTDRPRPAV
ncbi:MAG TPA: amino acid adenylation domain-containing protein, partial [Thermoanaerobaculia bacterium]|nr:amino acid adenylation domain-containing protein [Thermoanaerobaculia bacterium]